MPKPDAGADDLSKEEVAQLHAALAGFPRLPFMLDEQQDGDDDGPVPGTVICGLLVRSLPTDIARGADEFEEMGGLGNDNANRLAVAALNALPRLLRELERRRAQDIRIAAWENATLVNRVAAMINDAAHARWDMTCQNCRRNGRTCNRHIAEGIIHEVREQRLVMVTAETADGVVETAKEDAVKPVVDTLRMAAAGRREYADGAPGDREKDLLNAEANVLESAARIAEGDITPLFGLLPARRWTAEMVERVHAARAEASQA